MMPVRVLNLFTNMNRGGAETMVMNYYRALDRSRIQFDFMVHRPLRGDYEDEIESLGGHIFRMPPIRLENLFRYQKALDAFFREHSEYKVVHAHMSELGYFAFKAARNYSVPVRICHAHNYPLCFDPKTIPRFFLKHFCLKHITHMFSCGQNAGEWLFGKKNRGRIILMRNAIDSRQFAFSEEARNFQRNQMGIEGRFVVGHIGRFEYQKNHKFLLDVFVRLLEKEPSAILILVGDGLMRKDIERQAKVIGVAGNIRFLGMRKDIPHLLDVMDIFVFPSRYEGLPLTMIEAQASGLPCLVSDAVSKECDVTGNLRFLPLSASAEFWADEILKLREKRRLADAVERVVRAGYDVHTNAKWLTDFYLGEYSKYTGKVA